MFLHEKPLCDDDILAGNQSCQKGFFISFLLLIQAKSRLKEYKAYPSNCLQSEPFPAWFPQRSISSWKETNEKVLLPKSEGKPMAAGPGPWNSAAMGPRLLVGVQDPLCPPILLDFDHTWPQYVFIWKNEEKSSITTTGGRSRVACSELSGGAIMSKFHVRLAQEL